MFATATALRYGKSEPRRQHSWGRLIEATVSTGFYFSCLLHVVSQSCNPVNSRQEQEWWLTSLPDSSKNPKAKGDLASMCDFACHVLIDIANQADKTFTHSHELPNSLSVQAVESLEEFHQMDCSSITRRVTIWSEQDLSLQRPAWLSLSLSFPRVLSLSMMTLQRTFSSRSRSPRGSLWFWNGRRINS